MFASGKPLNPTALRIMDDLLTKEIKPSKAYKVYGAAFKGVVVPMMSPSPVVSTQGRHRTLSAPRSPKPKRTPRKRGSKWVRSQVNKRIH
nr:hypothetical protein [Tanacetum cinerariifolium]